MKKVKNVKKRLANIDLGVLLVSLTMSAMFFYVGLGFYIGQWDGVAFVSAFAGVLMVVFAIKDAVEMFNEPIKNY